MRFFKKKEIKHTLCQHTNISYNFVYDIFYCCDCNQEVSSGYVIMRNIKKIKELEQKLTENKEV